MNRQLSSLMRSLISWSNREITCKYQGCIFILQCFDPVQEKAYVCLLWKSKYLSTTEVWCPHPQHHPRVLTQNLLAVTCLGCVLVWFLHLWKPFALPFRGSIQGRSSPEAYTSSNMVLFNFWFFSPHSLLQQINY